MNQAEFDKLPMLLRRAEVCRVLGLDEDAVTKWRRARAEQNKPVAKQLAGGTEWRFYKKEVAREAGLEYRWAEREICVREVIERLERIEKAVMANAPQRTQRNAEVRP